MRRSRMAIPPAEVRDVSHLVGVDGHRVRERDRLVGGPHLPARDSRPPVREAFRREPALELGVGEEPSVRIEEKAPPVTAVGGIHMEVERETPTLELLAQPDDPTDIVDGSFLGGTHYPDNGEDRCLLFHAVVQGRSEAVEVHAEIIVHRNAHELVHSDPENVDRLLPGVVPARRDEHLSPAFRGAGRAPHGSFERLREGTVLLGGVQEVEYLRSRQVEEFPFRPAAYETGACLLHGERE